MRTYDYDVGFGRPPEGHRFKKGQSGNPRGRKPKPRVGLARTIEKLLMEPVAVTDKGVSRRASALELIVMQLLGKLSDGKGGAYRAFRRYQAYARARPQPRRSVSAEDANEYARLLEEGIESAAPLGDSRPRRRKRSVKKTKLTIEERIERMRAGLEAIEMPDGVNARQAMEIYEISLREPPTRPPIRLPRSRKDLSADEIFDLALYSTLAGKFGGRVSPTRIGLVIRRLVMKAVGGDVRSAALILDLHAQAEKHGDL
jgi:hypothetical protein